ncbi:LysR family transcriptional regulator [Aminobacter aminovorans]|uniref:LysR family transcriptional regulator n=1 Tax=Aminobacter aminovorans TaxID=83263 RepID=UPI00285CD756|nr:LysR family transcriptional regulator [Aminobacter aminovorans]MDR7224805.1 DNA-binding transcriptional LysR family regulator [Aminobacter aminovorans]
MLDNLTLDQMRTFVAVVESGSFRAGAARLSRVQSAISHAIGNLEAELKVALFTRTGRKPELTAEGQALLADARAVLIKVDAMRARARGLGQGLELSLAIAVDPVIPAGILAGALYDLRTEHPSVGVALKTLPMRAALHALINRHCRLAITTDTQRDGLVEAECLGPAQPFVAVCAAHHPLAKAPAAGWSAVELSDHLQIVVSDPSPMSEGLDFGVLSPGTWRVSDLASKLALIRAGVGWGNLPRWMVDDDLASRNLVRVAATALGSQSETALTAYLLWRIDQPPGPAARYLRERLLARFGGGG